MRTPEDLRRMFPPLGKRSSARKAHKPTKRAREIANSPARFVKYTPSRSAR